MWSHYTLNIGLVHLEFIHLIKSDMFRTFIKKFHKAMRKKGKEIFEFFVDRYFFHAFFVFYDSGRSYL